MQAIKRADGFICFRTLSRSFYAHIAFDFRITRTAAIHVTASVAGTAIQTPVIAYIQEHYRERISLADIVRAGGVGKTSCCTIFRQFINQTPNTYLTDYRLRRGMELLLSTNLTVTEICYKVGFSGGSYFTETFHKYLGYSPGEYRKNHTALPALSP